MTIASGPAAQSNERTKPISPDRSSTSAIQPEATRVLESEALLQGQGSVWIRHRGVTYRLHCTRQGKLLLTK